MAIKYKNPILKGFYPDPGICRKGDDYYMVTSSFEFFPGVPIFHSKDLVNWTQIGHCLTRESQLPLHNVRYSMGIFAPVIRYHKQKDRFYMVTTNVTKFGNFFVYADDPLGEWSEPILINQGGIDPSLFFEDDGTAYFISNAYEGDDPRSGFLLSQIDLETGRLLTKPTPVWGGIGESAPEAPHIYKIGAWYYQMIAEGGTELGHMETIARSRNLFGPYEPCPMNPILTHRNKKNHQIQATGHADLIQDIYGEWWAVFLGYRETHAYFHHLGRETFLAPVEWVDEWPIINGGRAIEFEMNVPSKAVILQSRVNEYHTDFTKGIELPFVHLRNPYPENYESTESGLKLIGSEFNLADEDSPTFLGFRQKDHESRLEIDFSFSPIVNGDEAGVTVFYKHDAHMDVYVGMENGRRFLCFKKSVGDILHICAYLPIFEGELSDDKITIIVKSDKLKYYFSAVVDGKEIFLGEGLTRYVSTESHQLGFTGTFLAIYATGNGKKASSDALFSRFEYYGFDD
ncbi:MAG: glycoside hydrolase family 43 protein [Lachnospiraceae bacterium]|nr:glycoside hydrolase family 43 protein [Lachnospiraceae bacterium]